jgi:hypothetical protein
MDRQRVEPDDTPEVEAALEALQAAVDKPRDELIEIARRDLLANGWLEEMGQVTRHGY